MELREKNIPEKKKGRNERESWRSNSGRYKRRCFLYAYTHKLPLHFVIAFTNFGSCTLALSDKLITLEIQKIQFYHWLNPLFTTFCLESLVMAKFFAAAVFSRSHTNTTFIK